jgi:hypothetical protein
VCAQELCALGARKMLGSTFGPLLLALGRHGFSFFETKLFVEISSSTPRLVNLITHQAERKLNFGESNY